MTAPETAEERSTRLMRVVQLSDGPTGVINVLCGWCPQVLIGFGEDIDEANEAKIEHENFHGIYVDPDTDLYWHDPADDQGT